MPIFGDTADLFTPINPYVHGFAVAVSKWTATAAAGAGAETDPFPLPAYGPFAIDNRIRFMECFVGTTISGMSYCRLGLVLGVPGANVNVEDAGTILGRGDRVVIGVWDDYAQTQVRWIWSGICTRIEFQIAGGAETALYTCRGPEWIWGDGAGRGATRPFMGQVRRLAPADDTWAVGATPDTVLTDPADVGPCRSEPAIFNPGGRANMSVGKVDYPDGPAAIWEIPDRRMGATPLAKRWTVRDAVLTCFAIFGAAANAVPPDLTAIPVDDLLPETNIEGMGLWGALHAILGQKYGFYLDPRPAADTAALPAWGPFQCHVFSRSTGPAASLYLNPRGTSLTAATPSVSRLHLVADIEKVVNKITFYGRRQFHVSLRYMGGQTGANTAKVNLLQHGWTKSDGDLSAYGANTNKNYVAGSLDPAKQPRWEVTGHTIDSLGKAEEWRRKFTAAGKDFEQNRHVFRLFTWNEAREWGDPTNTAPNQPLYYATTNGASVNWVAPDLEAIFGAGSNPVRQRRPLADTRWEASKVDTFQRVRPTLFASIVKPDDTQGPWYKVSTSKYQIDPERAAVYITADDLAVWAPFADEQDTEFNLPQDGRSFATLLWNGVLRRALEGCIEGDNPEMANPAVPADSGSPFWRQTAIRSGPQFVKVTDFDAGDGFVMAGTGTLVDDSAAAATVAGQILDAGKDAQVHSSILVECDWPRQAIGSTIAALAGRNLPMLTGQSALTGRPAQIVGLRMDAEALKWELLTESAAIALKASLRRAQAGTRDEATRRRDTRTVRPPRVILNPAGE